MKKNERKLLILAGILFAAVMALRVVPMAVGYYQEGREEIARLEQRMERYRDLIAETGRWTQREAEKQAEVAELRDWIFPGSDRNLVASSVQRELGRAAEAAELTVREMSVARYFNLDGWLMVNQEMSFIIDQNNILKFLNFLHETRPHLHVTEFSITRSRRNYTGSITVTGFSRRES